MNKTLRTKQGGAALFVAIIMLLLITLLSLSSVRESTLESRVTGNTAFQQKLVSAAEAGLRDGEISLLKNRLGEPKGVCPDDDSDQPCLLSGVPKYTPQFGEVGGSRSYKPTDNTQIAEGSSVRWYAQVAPDGSSEAVSVNAEYGSASGFAGGNSSANAATTAYYELNSQGKSTTLPNTVYLRSTIVKISD